MGTFRPGCVPVCWHEAHRGVLPFLHSVGTRLAAECRSLVTNPAQRSIIVMQLSAATIPALLSFPLLGGSGNGSGRRSGRRSSAIGFRFPSWVSKVLKKEKGKRIDHLGLDGGEAIRTDPRERDLGCQHSFCFKRAGSSFPMGCHWLYRPTQPLQIFFRAYFF